MTWSGWFANKFSRDVEPPEYKLSDGGEHARSILGPPKVYENVPESCTSAAQAVQNYHANLQILEDCETDEQKETCKVICDNMYRMAVKEIDGLKNEQQTMNAQSQKFFNTIQEDIQTLRQRQLALQQLQRGLTPTGTTIDKNKAKLFEGANQDVKDGDSKGTSPLDRVAMQQEEHLDTMAKHLNELGSLAGHLNFSLAKHSDTLGALDEKNDSMLLKTKMVTRRADRLIQKKSWVREKAEFAYNAYIRHQATGKYLSVAPNNDSTLVLSSVLNERCIFGVWKGKRVFGLQNKYNRRWAGQSLLGNLTCSASSFGRREEWDADDDWTDTNLVVASAGWGHGGYLLLDDNNSLPTIGGGTVEDKNKAPKWSIHEFQKK
jgi:hypothetical protein